MKRIISLLTILALLLTFALSVSALKTVPVNGITLDKVTIALDIGKTYNLKTTFQPANTTQKLLKFVTSDKNIATVDKTGKITAVKVGSAVITVASVSNAKAVAKCNVSVLATAGKYPVKTNVTLTYWIPNGFLAPNITKWQDVPYLVELEKRTGIKVNYILSTGTDVKQAFNLMLASGNLPDIIDNLQFDGGVQAGLDNKYIIPINDLMVQYCPNFYNYLKANPELDKACKTDSGVYSFFPLVRNEVELRCYGGPILRKDWLNELGLQVPTTIDEWTKVLTAFKNKGIQSPLVLAAPNDAGAKNPYTAFAGAYGIEYDFFLYNGKVKYGPAEKAFKDFLTTMHQWYADGLIDKNFATSSATARNAAMTSGTAGASQGNVGGGIGNWLQAAVPQNPTYDLVGAPYPTLVKGAKPEHGFRDYAVNSVSSAAITTSCKHPDIAARFLDYGYSKEGHMFYNFGTEGLSYNLVNGTPVYTGIITQNPKGIPMAQAMKYYCGPNARGSCFAQDINYFRQYSSLPQQQDAVRKWSNTNEANHLLPPVTYTSAESSEYSKLKTNIDTFVNENFVKFVMGVTPLSSFDSYLSDLNKLNVSRAIAINQAAVDRYNKR